MNIEQEALVSIVLPIYNVEQYLCLCLNSVCGQTYKNVEIILVDDGSTDSSSSICDEYANKDKRIKVIHKCNGGLSDARNAGLKIANGKYIAFIDSDDIISTHMIENLYNACVESGSKISVCKFIYFNGLICEDEVLNPSNTFVISGKQYIEMVYKGKGEMFAFTAWNKLYDKSLFDLNNIKYPINKYYEDTEVTNKLFYMSDKVVCIEDALYFYRIREGSITSKFTVKHCIDGIETDLNTIQFFAEEKDNLLLSLAFKSYCRSTMITYKSFLKKMKKTEKKECQKLLIKNYRNTYKRFIKTISLSLLHKLSFKIFYLIPNLVFIMPIK